MNVIHDEAFESYKPDIILVLDSNVEEDLQANMDRLQKYANQYQPRQVPAGPPSAIWEEETRDSEQDDSDEESLTQRTTASWPAPLATDDSRSNHDDDSEDQYMEELGLGAKRKRA